MGQTDGRADGRTDRAIPECPLGRGHSSHCDIFATVCNSGKDYSRNCLENFSVCGLFTVQTNIEFIHVYTPESDLSPNVL